MLVGRCHRRHGDLRAQRDAGRAVSDSAASSPTSYARRHAVRGLVVDQLVDVGDPVTTVDRCSSSDSATLRTTSRTASRVLRPRGDPIDAAGSLVVLRHGRRRGHGRPLRTRDVRPAAAQLATVQRADTLYVQAEYTLTPKEYARVATTPPSRSCCRTSARSRPRVRGPGRDGRGSAQAVLTLTGASLKDGAENGLVSAGTPVTAELHLDNDGVVTRTAASSRPTWEDSSADDSTTGP